MYHIILPGRMQTEEWLEYLHQNPKTHQSDTHLAQWDLLEKYGL